MNILNGAEMKTYVTGKGFRYEVENVSVVAVITLSYHDVQFAIHLLGSEWSIQVTDKKHNLTAYGHPIGHKDRPIISSLRGAIQYADDIAEVLLLENGLDE